AAAAMVAAAVRTSLDGSPDAVQEEVKARLAMVEPALKEMVKAGPSGDPALNGDMKAMRNTGLHLDMGCGADNLPQDGKETKRRQRSGRKIKEKANLRLAAEPGECEEGHFSEASCTSAANQHVEQNQVDCKPSEDPSLVHEVIDVSVEAFVQKVPKEADEDQHIGVKVKKPQDDAVEVATLTLSAAKQKIEGTACVVFELEAQLESARAVHLAACEEAVDAGFEAIDFGEAGS
ncbi:unnamed protein product, partial [Prorocentrum cordatum]